MAFVLDASVTACWTFQDEDHPDAHLASANAHHRGGRTLLVVVRGAQYLGGERTGRRITEPDTAAFLLNLARLRVRIDRLPDEAAVLRLARIHRLSVYDSAYLELAQREGLPLATLDGDLRRAAASEGVAPFSEDNVEPSKESPPDPSDLGK